MSTDFPHAVQIPWSHIREALDLMELTALCPFKPVPIGNRVVVACQDEHDALRLAACFSGARTVKDRA